MCEPQVLSALPYAHTLVGLASTERVKSMSGREKREKRRVREQCRSIVHRTAGRLWERLRRQKRGQRDRRSGQPGSTLLLRHHFCDGCDRIVGCHGSEAHLKRIRTKFQVDITAKSKARTTMRLDICYVYAAVSMLAGVPDSPSLARYLSPIESLRNSCSGYPCGDALLFCSATSLKVQQCQ